MSFGKSTDNIKDCLRKHLGVQPDDLLLDVGCGTAKYIDFAPCQYVGTDINSEYVKHAAIEHPAGKFFVMDAAKLEFPDNNFDAMMNVCVLHHIEDEKVKLALSEMKRVCKFGGKIVIIEAVYPPLRNILGNFLFKMDRGEHTRKLSELKKIMDEAGFALAQDGIKNDFPYRLVVFEYIKK